MVLFRDGPFGGPGGRPRPNGDHGPPEMIEKLIAMLKNKLHQAKFDPYNWSSEEMLSSEEVENSEE